MTDAYDALVRHVSLALLRGVPPAACLRAVQEGVERWMQERCCYDSSCDSIWAAKEQRTHVEKETDHA